MTSRPDLGRLADADLEPLRLGAQVLGHKAELDSRPFVAAYFEELEAALRAEIGRRESVERAAEARSGADLALVVPPHPDDRRVVAEYLGLLVANERLSPALRQLCRELRARDSR